MTTSIRCDSETPPSIKLVSGCRIHGRDKQLLFNVKIQDGKISEITDAENKTSTLGGDVGDGELLAQGRLLLPSLCHAHIHLDKCFLLQDQKFEAHKIQNGDFNEAMKITGQAKSQFEHEDLCRRGRRLIQESIAAGVTAMRAFVEADEVAELRAVGAALSLKREFASRCHIQICAFAQLALFEPGDVGWRRRHLLVQALKFDEVHAVGSTPYVEQDRPASEENVRWTIRQAQSYGKHLDFHLDYHLDEQSEPMAKFVVQELGRVEWLSYSSAVGRQTVVLGHCSRLTLMTDNEWGHLKHPIQANKLPVSFVGLPTSDLYMMGRPSSETRLPGNRPRGTLQIPDMIEKHGLNGAISTNNVGNAFTPHSSCDPLQLASLGMLVYQAATIRHCELLYEMVSLRAESAIGLQGSNLELKVGDPADLILFGDAEGGRLPATVSDVVYDIESSRTVIYEGRLVADRSMSARLYGA